MEMTWDFGAGVQTTAEWSRGRGSGLWVPLLRLGERPALTQRGRRGHSQNPDLGSAGVLTPDS